MPTRKEQESMSEKLAKEKSWLWDHLTLPRRAQRSNTFIAQTKDAIVKKEFRNIARNGHLTELFKPADSQGKPLEYNNVFDYDLQRNESWNLKNIPNPAHMEWDNPLKELDIALRGGPTVAIIDYVFLQNHADTISDYLAAWSQDALLYAYKSTVIVFTSNIALFNQTLRELCYSFTIPASTDGERWEIGRKTISDISAGFQAKYGEPLKEVMTEELVQASRGLNKQQVQTALMMGFFKDRKFKVEHFTELKTDIVKGHGLQYVEPKTGFERIGGYEIYKQYMRERFVAPLRDPERAVKYGIGVPRGIKHLR